MLRRPALIVAASLPALAFATSSFADAAVAEAPTTVEDLVVTAAGHEQRVAEAPASISVITREQLDRQPYREITDALLEIPGVTIVAGEGNSRDISIRGMASQYTLILVDGKRLNSRESRTNGGNISEGGQLPPVEAIDRIEVVRGPMSSLYGSDAMGGVINIITRGVGADWNGVVSVNGTLQGESGFRDAYAGNLYLSGPLVADRLGLQVSAATNRRNEDHIIGGTPEREDNSVSGKLTWDLTPDHRLQFEAGYYEQQVTTTVGKTVAISSTALEGTKSVQTQEREVYSISHRGDWGWATSNSYIQREDATGVEAQKRIINTTGQTSFIIPVGPHTFNVGGFYMHEDLTDLTGNRLSGSTRTGADRTTYAVFVEDQWKLLDSFALTGGVRVDNDEQYGTHYTPRLYAVWTPTESLTVKGGVATGFRAPSLRQTLADWGQTSRGGTIYGNPDLEAETSTTGEVSVLYQRGGLQLSASVYQTDFKDKITRVTCAEAGAWCIDEPLSSIGRPPTTYVNVDEARIRGLEVTASVPLPADFSLVATGTLTESEQLTGANAGRALNDTPKQQGSISLNWRPESLPVNGYVRAIYRGEEAVTEAQISGSNIFADAYTTVDIGGAWRVTDALRLQGGVQNLFNKRINYEDAGYVIDGARLWVGISASF